MTRTEVIKELLKSNLDELNYNLDLKIKIYFKGGNEFVVVDKNIIISEGDMLNYDLSFESQKKFVSDVMNKIFKTLKDKKEYEKIKDKNILISYMCEDDLQNILNSINRFLKTAMTSLYLIERD